LINQGATTADPTARGQVYAELQSYLWQNLVHIPLYNSDFTVAHANSVSGITVLPNFTTDFKRASFTEG
jgi:ABC-type transport system substrate-binding protein